MAVTHSGSLLSLSTQVVSAYLQHNPVSTEELPSLISDVRRALSSVDVPEPPEEPPLVPAVPPKRSVHDDYIICLDCGAKLSMLKRHLRTAHGMSPNEYRVRWSLPNSYPLTAPRYAAQRSALAKQAGLGLKEQGSNERADNEEAPLEAAPANPSEETADDDTGSTVDHATPKRKARRGPQLRRRQPRRKS